MRKHSTLTTVLLLEVAAIALATLQFRVGLVSDEAKYLLSIPYPHPPLLRSVLAATAAMPMHEFFWRCVFASALVQAVWFVWDLGDVLTRARRIALAASWLLSSAVILQAGTIVMSVASAISGLIFLWWTLHPAPPKKPAMIACLWLASLFTAYQSIVFAPLVLSGLLRSEKSRRKVLLYLCIPLVLLGLYSLTNPLALTLLFHISGQDAAIPVLTRFFNVSWVWIVAGSGLLSIVGTIGILSSVRVDLVATFGLLLGYVILTTASYYAILFTPLFIGGLFLLFCKRRLKPSTFILLQSACAMTVVFLLFPSFRETPARAEMRLLAPENLSGTLLIDGFFGHDWQYESTLPVRRFSQELSLESEKKAAVFICTKSSGCDDDVNDDVWTELPGMPLSTWVRKASGS